MEIKISDNERIDDLNLDGLKIIQKIGGYGFTSDSVLLANFVGCKRSSTCVEIGAGSGVISVLVNYKEKPQSIYAFEVQKDVSELARRNFAINGYDKNIIMINDLVQNYEAYIQSNSIDVVFSNPPYFKYDSKVCGDNDEKIISRFDKFLTLNQLVETASKMLKFGGKFFFVYDSCRFAETVKILKENNLSPKRAYFVHPNEKKNSTVFLCECIKGGKDSLIIMPPLFTNNLDGDYVQTIQKLYKK